MLMRADKTGDLGDILDAMRGPVAAMCVGPVTSAPLEALNVPTTAPAAGTCWARSRDTSSTNLPQRANKIQAGEHENQHFAAVA